jgi:hypothetical protein
MKRGLFLIIPLMTPPRPSPFPTPPPPPLLL